MGAVAALVARARRLGDPRSSAGVTRPPAVALRRLIGLAGAVDGARRCLGLLVYVVVAVAMCAGTPR